MAGGMAVAVMVLVEAALRWPAVLHGSDVRADPTLPQATLLLGLPLGLVLGLVHRRVALAALFLLALTLGDPVLASVGVVVIAAIAVELAWRRPLVGAMPFFVLLGACVLLRTPAAPRDNPVAPDIVVVVLDTVSARSTSLHGNVLPTTPNLQALAAEGTSYRHALAAAPWTVPSHAALFTGRLPQDLGCHHEHPQLDPGPPTTAELLGAAGYRTGAFIANPWVGDFNGLTRGFGHVESGWERARAARAFTLLSLVPSRPSKGGAGLVAASLDWLDESGDQPSMLFLNLLEAHSPFHQAADADRFGVVDPLSVSERTHRVQHGGLSAVPDYPRPGELDAARTLYAGAVHASDALLATLRAGLEERGRWNDTVLVVTSDHGEAFGEHGFHGHMVGLYQESLHVPLVLRVPGQGPAEVTGPVSLSRLHPTLLRIAGVADPDAGLPLPLSGPAEDLPVISEQLRPVQVLSDFEREGGASHLGELDARAVRVVQGTLALSLQVPADGGPERWRLYDLAADPTETHDLWPQRTELDEATQVRVGELVAVAEGRAARFEASSAVAAGPQVEGDLRAQLEALGYLGGD